MSRKVIVNLPADLEKHVEGVDGRRLPSMIIEALRAQWFKEEITVEMAPDLLEHIVAGHHKRHHHIEPELPVFGSIPAERKHG